MSSLIRNLRLVHKLVLLGLMAALLVAVPLTAYVRGALSGLTAIEAERRGLAPSQALLEVVRLAQIHRGMTATVLGGKADAETQRQARAAEVQQAVQRFEAQLAGGVDNARIRSDWRAIAGQWQSLSQAVDARGVTGPESFARHTAMITGLIELNDRVADHFGLSSDPDKSTYFLIIGTLQQMPRLTETLGQARARGSALERACGTARTRHQPGEGVRTRRHAQGPSGGHARAGAQRFRGGAQAGAHGGSPRRRR